MATIRLEGDTGNPHSHGDEQPEDECRTQWAQQLDSEAQWSPEE